MGIWIAIAIGVFIVGSIMGLKPSARETMRDNLRMAARRVGVQPNWSHAPIGLSAIQANAVKA